MKIVETVNGVPVGPEGLAALVAGSVLRYRYKATESEAHLFDHAEIRRRFAAAHSLTIVPEITHAERVRSAAVAEARDPEAKLRAWGEATGTTISDSTVARLREIQEAVR